MEEIEITDIILNGGNGGDWTCPPEVPVDKYDEPSIVQLPDASDANFENANDTSSIADPQEKGAAVSQESKNTKKKTCAVALVASIAILAGVVGLGAGLGTKKNGNVSAANGAVTLEDCLRLAEDGAIGEFDDADEFTVSSVNGVPTNEPTTWEPTTGEVLLEEELEDDTDGDTTNEEIKFSNDVMAYIDLGINGDGPERRDLRGVGSAAKKATGLKDASAKKTRKLQCQDLLDGYTSSTSRSKSSKSKTSKSTLSKTSKSKSSKKKPCMAGQTGFTKVDTSGSSKSTTVTRLDNLQVGDTIHGLDEFKSKNEACEIISLTSAGDRTVYGNYTDDHFILSEEDPGTLVAHGEAGQTEEFTTVYQVLSTCPVVTDETGKESTFTICAKSLAVDGSLPWSSYLRIHATLLRLVLETGVRTISSFYDIDKAREYLPTLCTSGLVCSESGDCDEFEAAIRIFVQQEIVPDKIDQVMAAFPSIGEASSKGSVSDLISSGKSVR
eukprot:CAMPEP_0172317898 /NCGR_PEP_ID=MMETSP1058-20130122/33198_1 /TAXON_ID=83371 /ORGANISM="Detonula confervacea, Strain CCMP 353" /LENGTH=497 /DNA_ID=CAMNT_0013032579 /DNA_START=60 /DNA_END=1553 /DNA_ORIENTATION=+